MKKLIIILLFGVLSACTDDLGKGSVGSVDNDNNSNNGDNGDNGNGGDSGECTSDVGGVDPGDTGDGGGECVAGDIDSNNDGVRESSSECWPNENQKTEIHYYPGGTAKAIKNTYYEDGNRKTATRFESDGVTIEQRRCYKSDGDSIFSGPCHPVRHGLPTEYMILTYYDAANTKLETYAQHRDTAKTVKLTEAAYRENGNIKTEILYASNGTTRVIKDSYYGNEWLKTSIAYENDGSTIRNIGCYLFVLRGASDRSNGEPCHPVRHGLPAEYMTLAYHDAANTKLETYTQYRDTAMTVKLTEAAYRENGKLKAWIRYNGYPGGGDNPKDYERTYDENENLKIEIGYDSDGTTKAYEETYYENESKKTEIKYYSDGAIDEINCK